jgi:hypothetical protein
VTRSRRSALFDFEGKEITKSPLTVPEVIVAMLLFVTMLGLHLTFTPWLFDSHPIDEIQYYELENVPAPSDAQSFAINHGSAIYYEDGVPSEHPIKRITILGAALAMWAGLIGIAFRARKRARSTATE